MSELSAMWDALPQLARAAIVCIPMLGAWFLTCRCIEYHAVKNQLRRALAPVFKPHCITVFDLIAYPARTIKCGIAVLDLLDRMGNTKERRYVCRKAIDSLPSTPVKEFLLPTLKMHQNRASGIPRILAMFWPACW